MKRLTLAAIFGFMLGYGVFVSGQVTSATNLAGAAFPLTQWMPTKMTGRKQTTDMTSKNFYSGVEIRTPGIIVRADEAVHDVTTGRIELRGTVTATLVPMRPIWPDSQR